MMRNSLFLGVGGVRRARSWQKKMRRCRGQLQRKRRRESFSGFSRGCAVSPKPGVRWHLRVIA